MTKTAQDVIKELVIENLLESLQISLDELKTKIDYDEEEELLYESVLYYDESLVWDILEDLRSGGIETNLPTEKPSRHYEYYEVAMQTKDGTWVGWTYYYGGGKHGYPEEMPWIENAYLLECEEFEKLVTVREFKKL